MSWIDILKRLLKVAQWQESFEQTDLSKSLRS